MSRRARVTPSPSADRLRLSPRLAWWRPTIIVLVTLLTYASSLSLPLVFDDRVTILENPQIRNPWTVDVLRPARELPVAGRPLANLTFAWNYAVGGTAVEGYHLVNLALHLACALALFGVVRRTLQLPGLSSWRPHADDLACATALLWAVHPLNSEVVNYLTQRTESLMALAVLMTLYASLRSRSSTRSTGWEIVAFLSCLAGMGAKETMAVAPVVVLLFHAAFVDGSLAAALKARPRLYGMLGATWLVLAGLMATSPRGLSAGFASGVSPWQYLWNQAPIVAHYLSLAVWPTKLVAHYGTPVELSPGDVLLPGAFVLALLVTTGIAFVRWPRAGYPGAWIFITLAPTSSLVPIATEVGAERRMYLAMMAVAAGACCLAGYALWLRRTDRTDAPDTAAATPRVFIVAVAFVAVAIGLGVLTVRRTREYASGLVLAQTSLERWPSATARLMVGTELAAAGRHKEALPYLREAAEQMPRGRYNLGVELFNAGELDEAGRQLQQFVSTYPDLIEAVPARALIGRTLAARRDWPAAIAEFEAVVRMAPGQSAGQELLVSALGDYGAELVGAGQLAEALVRFRRAAELAPSSATAQRNLATALYDSRDLDAAIASARRAVALAPADPAGHNLLGRALAVKGDLGQAVSELARAVELSPSDAGFQEDLARLRGVALAR